MHAQPRLLRTLISPSSILTVERSFSHTVPSSCVNKYTQLAICNGRYYDGTRFKAIRSLFAKMSELLKSAQAVICLVRIEKRQRKHYRGLRRVTKGRCRWVEESQKLWKRCAGYLA